MWTESPPRSSLLKEVYADADVIEKARSMLRAGSSDAFVSDYLGMRSGQVAVIREGLRTNLRGRPPAPVADPEGEEDRQEAEARRLDAERGSAALLAAIRRYLARCHKASPERSSAPPDGPGRGRGRHRTDRKECSRRRTNESDMTNESGKEQD
jgi:hypothetical protein